jgi:hypothetical protein
MTLARGLAERTETLARSLGADKAYAAAGLSQ